MDSILANFDIDKPQNFWKLYPTWKTPKKLRSMFDSDKSKDKKDSSMIMWAIVHMFDKTINNPYKLMDSEERVATINDDILDNAKFNWTKYEEEVDEVKKLMTTELERNRDNLIIYLENRRKFIEEQQKELDFSLISDIDKTIKANKDLLQELDRLNDAIELSDESGVTKGGKIESLNETGMLRQ